MSSKTRDECIQLIFMHLKILGLVPGAHSPYAKQLHTFLTISRIFHLFVAFKFMANNTHDIVLMAEGVRTFASHFQGTKVCTFFRENDTIAVLGEMEDFWYSEDVEKVYKQCKMVIKIFNVMVYSAYVGILLVPTLSGKYPFTAAYPEFPGAFFVLSVIFHFQILFDVSTVLAVEVFFLSATCFVYSQFKMLNERLEMLGTDTEIMQKEAIICVKYHNFLLQFVERLISMFSIALLIQYGISAISVCTELYVSDKQDMFGNMASFGFFIGLLFQLSLYCFPAELVTDEALKTSEFVFNSQWYMNPHVAKAFALAIIQRAQKTIVFTAGGLVEINRTAFTTICKWAMSFYMLMRDIEEAGK